MISACRSRPADGRSERLPVAGRIRPCALVLVAALFFLAHPVSAQEPSRLGVEVSSQPMMFLPGLTLLGVYERQMSPLLSLTASSGLTWTRATSLLHSQWSLASSSAVALLVRPVATGIELDAQLRLLSAEDGRLLPGSFATSLRFGPAVVSRLTLLHLGRRGPGLVVVPAAGLLWTATRGTLFGVPDWYLRVGIALMFRPRPRASPRTAPPSGGAGQSS